MPATNITFSDHETEYLLNIVNFYEVTKELYIYGEQIDPENRSLAQTINELRNCLDHLMRVVSYKLGLRPNTNGEKYVNTNLDKAYGHVYRAAYDTLDWVSLNLKDSIIRDLQGFSLETIQAVIPNYFSELKPKVDKILNEDIVRLRDDKDVAASSEDNLEKYIRVTAELKQLVQQISEKKPSLIEYQKRLNQSKRNQQVLRFGIDAAIAIGGGFLVWFIGWIATRPQN